MALKRKAKARKPSKKALPKRPVAKKPAKKAEPKKPMVPRPPRAPGETRYWLVKTEPEVFSFADLMAARDRTTTWDGVRNYQARNMLRDEMKVGDGVLVYHSNADPPAIAGIAVVARDGYPDHTQFEHKHHHYDPDADPGNPPWFMVDIKGVEPLSRTLGLPELREVKELARMTLLQKGSRLSVQPVSAAEWATVRRLGAAAG